MSNRFASERAVLGVAMGMMALVASVFASHATIYGRPVRKDPEQSRPLVTLLVKCPGPTVSSGAEWCTKVAEIESSIPCLSSQGIESEIEFPENDDGSGDRIYGGIVQMWFTHPRPADLKFALSAFGKAGNSEVLKTEVLWDGPARSRGMSTADADDLKCARAYSVDSLLTVAGAKRWRLSVNDSSNEPLGQLQRWRLKFLVGRLPFAHSRSYYQRLFFGDNRPHNPVHSPNVADYFREISGNRFSFHNAGIYGPVTIDGWDTLSTQERCVAASCQLEREGFDFRPLDKNHDGIVDMFELTVMAIHNERPAGVGRLDTDVNGTKLENSMLRAAPGVCTIPHQVDFETLTHELCHSLSPRVIDLYGKNAVLNEGLTVMGATLDNPADDKKSIYLDAWHRWKLGWIPQKMQLADNLTPGSATFVRSISSGSIYPCPMVLRVGKPESSDLEYYLFEYRDGMSYDNGANDRGIVAWHVHEDANGDPYVAEGHASDPRKSVFAVGPDLAWGAHKAWKPSDGRFRLRWSDKSLLDQTFWVEGLPDGQAGATLHWSVTKPAAVDNP